MNSPIAARAYARGRSPRSLSICHREKRLRGFAAVLLEYVMPSHAFYKQTDGARTALLWRGRSGAQRPCRKSASGRTTPTIPHKQNGNDRLSLSNKTMATSKTVNLIQRD